MFQGVATNTGYVANTGISGGPQEFWTYSISSSYGFHSGPSVVDGVLYTTNMRDFVYAIDVTTGNLLWSKTGLYAGNSWTQPAVANGVVIVPGGSGRTLFGLDTADGSKLWSHDNSGGKWMNSDPTVHNGTVYVGYSDSIVSLDPSSGGFNWRTSTGSETTEGAPAVSNGIVYVAFDQYKGPKKLLALDATNGNQLWEFPTPSKIWEGPTVANGTVFFAVDNGNVYGLDASSGSERWSVSTGRNISEPSTAHYGGTLFVPTGGGLLALDEQDGTQLWHFPDAHGTPIVVDGTLYVGSKNNALYGLDPTDGATRWKFDTDGEIEGAPAVVNGRVYVGSANGTVYALEGGGNTGTTAPNASFSYSPSVVESGTEVSFDASGSSDPDGFIDSYEWDVGGDGSVDYTGVQMAHTFDSLGTVPVTLTVTDNNGETGTETVDFDVAIEGSDQRISQAATIDSYSVSTFDQETLATDYVSALTSAVQSGDVTLAVAEEALERLILAESYTKSVLSGLGPQTYDRSATDYNLAPRSAELVVSILVDFAFAAIAIGDRAAKHLGKQISSSWAQDIVKNVGGVFIDEAIGLLTEVAASLGANASTLKSDTRGVSASVIQQIVDGTLTTTDAIVNELNNLETQFVDGLEHNLRYATEQGRQGNDATVHDLQEGLDHLVSGLNIDSLQTNGLSGMLSGSQQSLTDGVADIDARFTFAKGVMDNIETYLSRLDLVTNVENLLTAIENGDGVLAIISILRAIGAIISGLAAAVSRIFSYTVNRTTMYELGDSHYTTLDGIVKGASQW